MSISVLIFFALISCGWFEKSVDLEREKAELLKVHETDRKAHFNTNVDLLMSHAGDEFIYVVSGKIHRSKRDDDRKTIEAYFKNAKYYEWNDLEPPIVRISNDASMAWMIVRLKVKRSQKDDSGEEKSREFVYAGIMTYEKRDGKWIRVANVSTFE